MIRFNKSRRFAGKAGNAKNNRRKRRRTGQGTSWATTHHSGNHEEFAAALGSKDLPKPEDKNCPAEESLTGVINQQLHRDVVSQEQQNGRQLEVVAEKSVQYQTLKDDKENYIETETEHLEEAKETELEYAEREAKVERSYLKKQIKTEKAAIEQDEGYMAILSEKINADDSRVPFHVQSKAFFFALAFVFFIGEVAANTMIFGQVFSAGLVLAFPMGIVVSLALTIAGKWAGRMLATVLSYAHKRTIKIAAITIFVFGALCILLGILRAKGESPQPSHHASTAPAATYFTSDAMKMDTVATPAGTAVTWQYTQTSSVAPANAPVSSIDPLIVIGLSAVQLAIFLGVVLLSLGFWQHREQRLHYNEVIKRYWKRTEKVALLEKQRADIKVALLKRQRQDEQTFREDSYKLRHILDEKGDELAGLKGELNAGQATLRRKTWEHDARVKETVNYLRIQNLLARSEDRPGFYDNAPTVDTRSMNFSGEESNTSDSNNTNTDHTNT